MGSTKFKPVECGSRGNNQHGKSAKLDICTPYLDKPPNSYVNVASDWASPGSDHPGKTAITEKELVEPLTMRTRTHHTTRQATPQQHSNIASVTFPQQTKSFRGRDSSKVLSLASGLEYISGWGSASPNALPREITCLLLTGNNENAISARGHCATQLIHMHGASCAFSFILYSFISSPPPRRVISAFKYERRL